MVYSSQSNNSFHKPMRALDLINTPVDLVVNEGRLWTDNLAYCPCNFPSKTFTVVHIVRLVDHLSLKSNISHWSGWIGWRAVLVNWQSGVSLQPYQFTLEYISVARWTPMLKPCPECWFSVSQLQPWIDKMERMWRIRIYLIHAQKIPSLFFWSGKN